VGGFIASPGQPAPLKDGEFKSNSLPAVVSFGFDRVGPPSSLYVQRDDVLVLQAASSSVENVTFNIRFLQGPIAQGGQPSDASPKNPTGAINSRGIVEPITKVVGISAAQLNAIQTQAIVLGEGYLLSVGAIGFVQNARGTTFARAFLLRGSSTASPLGVFQPLFADYVTTTAPAGWPSGRFIHPSEGPGFMHRINQANPGAGLDFSFQATAGQRWRVQSLVASLTTSAAVANRQVHALVQDSGGTTYWNESALAVQAAGTTVVYSFGPGLTPQTTTDGVQIVGLPSNLILAQTDLIKTATTNIQAGDQWSLINMSVEQLLDLV
jgi:hypothetical protein